MIRWAKTGMCAMAVLLCIEADSHGQEPPNCDGPFDPAYCQQVALAAKVLAAAGEEPPHLVLTCDPLTGTTLVLHVSQEGRDCTTPVPDDYAFEVWVDPGQHVTAEHGDVVTGSVRITGDKGARDTGQPATPSLHRFDPFRNFSDVTFTVSDDAKRVVAKTKIRLLHHYRINLGLAVLMGNSPVSYSVVNKQIQENQPDVDIAYEAMFHFYLSSRVFDYMYDTAIERFSVVLGFPVAHPTDALFIGLGWEPVPGATFVGGVQLRQVAQLRPGVVLGAPTGDSMVPTRTVLDARFFGLGVSLDTGIAKAILAAFK